MFVVANMKDNKLIGEISIPVNILLQYREFDRVAKPAPVIAFMHTTTVGALVDDIKSQGLIKNLELSIIDGKLALLTDGNHRIAALHELKIENCKVDILYYNSELIKDFFYDHTIERFKPISEELQAVLLTQKIDLNQFRIDPALKIN